MSGSIAVEQAGACTRQIRLNRPERANALNLEMTLTLIEALSECYFDSTKLVVLSGAGTHFCSGFDRTLSARSSAAEMALLGTQIEVLLQLIWSAPFVTVANVRGSAVGGGADIVVACDYRLAAPDAVLFFPGFRLLGVSLGNRRLAQVVGGGRAIDAIYRSKRIAREEAVRWGLLIAVANPADSSSLVAELEEALVATDKRSIAAVKAGIRGELPERPFGHIPELQSRHYNITIF